MSAVIGPSPAKLIRMFVIGSLGLTVTLAGIVAAVALSFFGSDWLASSGWVIIAVGAGVLVCAFGALCLGGAIARKPRVEIGLEEFVVRMHFWSRARRWSDIEGEFTVIRIASLEAVGYHLTASFKEASGIKPPRSLGGNDEAISGAYTITLTELAAILNDHKQRASPS
jgi:hypothetical protein